MEYQSFHEPIASFFKFRPCYCCMRKDSNRTNTQLTDGKWLRLPTKETEMQGQLDGTVNKCRGRSMDQTYIEVNTV